jgi:hypothetical protein
VQAFSPRDAIPPRMAVTVLSRMQVRSGVWGVTQSAISCPTNSDALSVDVRQGWMQLIFRSRRSDRSSSLCSLIDRPSPAQESGLDFLEAKPGDARPPMCVTKLCWLNLSHTPRIRDSPMHVIYDFIGHLPISSAFYCSRGSGVMKCPIGQV